MLQYRVTKYDPAFRDSSGWYVRDEWTSVSDVGRTFGGKVLTKDEYQRVEDAYVAAALSFLRESGQVSLTVQGLENHRQYATDIAEGSELRPEQIEKVVRLLLREEFWCRLEGSRCFLHTGYDYYLYVGVARPCPESLALAKSLGLFVEEFPSPYRIRESGA